MVNMLSLKEIIEDSNTKLGKIFDLVIQGLIVFSLVTFSIETLPDLSESTKYYLNIAEAVTVMIFTTEYLLRLYVSDKKINFVFSFFGIIDVLAVLPFYISSGIDLRSIRIFRLLRLVRILKLARYNKAVRRFRCAFFIVKEELALFFFVAMFVLYLSGVGIYYFENSAQPDVFKSVFHSLWWSVATLTTVGYGDIYPITVGGKCFTFVVLIVGLGIVSVPAGLVSSALSKAREIED